MVWNGYLAVATNHFTASALREWVCRMPWTPAARTCRVCQALYRTSSGLMQLDGSVHMTVGVGCPLGVGPPACSPLMYWYRPMVSKAWCSNSTCIMSDHVCACASPASYVSSAAPVDITGWPCSNSSMTLFTLPIGLTSGACRRP